MNHTPQALANKIEKLGQLPARPGVEWYRGYGVMGQTFTSGHVLAVRRFASSIGPRYTSIWHRDPGGSWDMWLDTDPDLGCPRYFSNQIRHVSQTPISITWPASNRLIVSIDDGRAFHWDVLLAATPITRIFSSLGSHMPPGLWRQKWMLTAMSTIAGPVLGAGAITLHGNTPNGHQFEANPARIWYLSHIQVSISGNDLGPTGPLPEQATLGGFRIPQRGIFAIGQSLFEIAA